MKTPFTASLPLRLLLAALLVPGVHAEAPAPAEGRVVDVQIVGLRRVVTTVDGSGKAVVQFDGDSPHAVKRPGRPNTMLRPKL